MSADSFLILTTRLVFLLLAIVTIVEYVRHRDQARLEIALLFTSLGYVSLAQIVIELGGISSGWLETSVLVAFLAHPYLLLRLVDHFWIVPRFIQRLALIGLLLSWVAVILFKSPLPPGPTIALVAYLTFAEGYASLAFLRGAMETTGVSQRRLLFASAGSGLLVLVVILAGVNSIWPDLSRFLTPLLRLTTLLTVLSYFAAFATPQWLRRSWQLAELYDFLNQSAGPWDSERQSEMLDNLCLAAVRAVGGLAAAVGLWKEDEERLQLVAVHDPDDRLAHFNVDSAPLISAWRSGEAQMLYLAEDFASTELEGLNEEGIGAMFTVPLETRHEIGGLLLVFISRPPLFVNDDLAMLTLFAEQSAVSLAYTQLLNRQELLITELRQQTAKLEAAYQELESFSYSVSHDLRAPLRHVVGYVKLLQKHIGSDLDSKGRRYLDVILESTHRMGNLIDALLASSRIGRVEMESRPIDLHGLTEEIIQDFQPDVQERVISWKIAELPKVQGDYALLRLVLTNLISNAIKFTRPRDKAEIEVGSYANGSETIFFVRDNGVGFDMAYMDQLFGVFKRLHNATEFEGTGIGLANVRRAVRRHGGRTWAEGSVGSGATFYFSLPRIPLNGQKEQEQT